MAVAVAVAVAEESRTFPDSCGTRDARRLPFGDGDGDRSPGSLATATATILGHGQPDGYESALLLLREVPQTLPGLSRVCERARLVQWVACLGYGRSCSS